MNVLVLRIPKTTGRKDVLHKAYYRGFVQARLRVRHLSGKASLLRKPNTYCLSGDSIREADGRRTFLASAKD